jgi:hypothetical protein
MRPLRSFTVAALALAASSVAWSQPLGTITVGDVPGSDGNWQYGSVTVAAPAKEVQRWFGDASRWAARFPDTEWSEVQGRTAAGREVVRFRSHIIGRTLTLWLREQPGLITYDGEGKDVTTQGKIYITALGPERTRVIMQSTSDVHGAAGLFASAKMRRERARKKFRADLGAVVRMSNAWAAAQRRKG